MQIFCVKIQDKDTKKFINNNEQFTRNGRTFATLSHAKSSASGKLGLSNLVNGNKETDYYERIFNIYMKKYLNSNFIIYTEQGEQFQSVKDYIVEYLNKYNRKDMVEILNGLEY